MSAPPSDPPGAHEDGARLCSAGTVIEIWTLSGQLVLKHTVTEAVEEEVAILGMLRYLCRKWRLPDNCLQAEWASPMKGKCDATLILRQHDGTFQWPTDGKVCSVCHVQVTNLNAIIRREYNNELCVMCQPRVLCDLCRICITARVMEVDDEGSERASRQKRVHVCLRCIREEELSQAAPKQRWLHELRRKCLGLEDEETESRLPAVLRPHEGELRLPTFTYSAPSSSSSSSGCDTEDS